MITVRRISVVRNSFRLLAPQRDKIFLRVYERLAESSPEFDGRYDTDLTRRAEIFKGVVELALLSLDHPTALVGTLQDLGRRYANYGSWHESHDLLIELLIDTLAEHSADSWTLEHSDAWRDVLQFIVRGMLDGAKKIRAA